jgi:hypothetical protein
LWQSGVKKRALAQRPARFSDARLPGNARGNARDESDIRDSRRGKNDLDTADVDA